MQIGKSRLKNSKSQVIRIRDLSNLIIIVVQCMDVDQTSCEKEKLSKELKKKRKRQNKQTK